MTSARLNGTPAASRLDSSRVKFSRSLAETFSPLNRSGMFPKSPKPAGKLKPGAVPATVFSKRLTGRRPSTSIWRNASGRPEASSAPSAIVPSACIALYWKVGMGSAEEHATSNIQHPTSNGRAAGAAIIECCMLDVGCWMLSLHFIFAPSPCRPASALRWSRPTFRSGLCARFLLRWSHSRPRQPW